MTTILILLGISFGTVMFFCRNIRQSVVNHLAAAGYYVAGTWNHLTNPDGGTNWTSVRTILRIALIALIVPLIAALFFVTVLATAITAIGLATGSTWVSIPFGIAFVIWFVFYQIPREINHLPVYGRLIQLTRWVAGIVALGCFVPLAMGIVMPNIKAAMFRSLANQERQTASNINEGSAHSEPEAGTIRKTKEDIYGIPDIPGKEPFFIKIGEVVRVLSWDTNRKANDHREGLVKIMVKNKFGHYNGGQEGWIPIRVLKEGSSAEKKKNTAKEPTASAAPVEKWKLCWKKPDGHYGASSVSALCGIAEEFRKNKDNFSAVFIFENGSSASFSGVSLDGKKYQGLWKDNLHSGEFFIDFLSEGSAIGHFVDKIGPVKVGFIATKI